MWTFAPVQDDRAVALNGPAYDEWEGMLTFRLSALLNVTPPTTWQSRDDVMVQLAHAVLWHGNASIQGGFVRDWLVRGETATDLDVGLTWPLQTPDTIEQAVRGFLAHSPSARQRGLCVSRRRRKEFAVAFSVEAPDFPPISIDIVDPSKIRKGLDEAGDSDASSLEISQAKSLHVKVNVPGNSLETTLDHVRRKQFVFYLALDSGDEIQDEVAFFRLRKHLRRGWTCLSRVPHAVIDELPPSERQFVQLTDSSRHEDSSCLK